MIRQLPSSWTSNSGAQLAHSVEVLNKRPGGVFSPSSFYFASFCFSCITWLLKLDSLIYAIGICHRISWIFCGKVICQPGKVVYADSSEMLGLVWLISRTFSANEQYFSLTPNQPTSFSAMAYQPNKHKRTGRLHAAPIPVLTQHVPTKAFTLNCYNF